MGFLKESFFVTIHLERWLCSYWSTWERKHQNVLILCPETGALLLLVKFPAPRQLDSLISFLIWFFYRFRCQFTSVLSLML